MTTDAFAHMTTDDLKLALSFVMECADALAEMLGQRVCGDDILRQYRLQCSRRDMYAAVIAQRTSR